MISAVEALSLSENKGYLLCGGLNWGLPVAEGAKKVELLCRGLVQHTKCARTAHDFQYSLFWCDSISASWAGGIHVLGVLQLD